MVTKGRPYGIAPAVPSLQNFVKILQGAGSSPYQIYKFPAAGRVWGALVSYAMSSSTGIGTVEGYAQVVTAAGLTLAIAECAIASPAAGNGSQDSNTGSLTYPGLIVPAGTVVQLDVNAAVAPAGLTQRASGLVSVSIP